MILLVASQVASTQQGSWPTLPQALANPAAPTHALSLPDECGISDIVWADDGSRALVSMSVSAVDLWPWLIYHWPEIIAGLITFILFMTLAWMVRRWWKRRNIDVVGEPYCAKCSYQLTGRTDAAHCPECGRTLSARSIVIGRRCRKWPIAIVVGLLIAHAVLFSYGSDHVPRTGTIASWQDWPSIRFYKWATNRKMSSVELFATTVGRLIEIDPTGLKRTRTIMTTRESDPDGYRWRYQLLPGSRDDTIFMSVQDGIYEINTDTGRAVNKFMLPVGFFGTRAGLDDIARHPSKPLLFAIFDYSTVVAWDIQTGQFREILTRSETSPDRYTHFRSLGTEIGVIRYIYSPNGLESEFTNLDTLETLSAPRDDNHPLLPTMRPAGNQVVATSTVQGPRSGWLYITVYSIGPGPGSAVAAVYDPSSESWLSVLQPPRIVDLNLSVSPDERWAIIGDRDPTRQAQLYIFDLSP